MTSILVTSILMTSILMRLILIKSIIQSQTDEINFDDFNFDDFILMTWNSMNSILMRTILSLAQLSPSLFHSFLWYSPQYLTQLYTSVRPSGNDGNGPWPNLWFRKWAINYKKKNWGWAVQRWENSCSFIRT